MSLSAAHEAYESQDAEPKIADMDCDEVSAHWAH